MGNDYPQCFACGKENPISLGLEFEQVAVQQVRAEFIPGPNHQGYEGIMHGGLVTTLLDEAMVQVIVAQGIEAVTAEIKVRFKSPVRIGERLSIFGKITGNKGRMVLTEGELHDQEGNILVLAEAKFIKLAAALNKEEKE